MYARRAFAMIHELPGMTWVKAGAFQPAFGTLIDDHTSPARTLFEATQAQSANTVVGVEVGTAPNYPFTQASLFANDASLLGATPDTGWGASVQGGWRDLTWSLRLSVTPVPGLTFDASARLLVLPSGQLGSDALVLTHVWL